MKYLHFLLFILLLSSINFYTCEELLDLTCLTDSHCSQFKKHQTNINVNCIKGHCECSLVDTGENIKCKPRDIKHSNVIGGACPCSLPNAECNVEQDICYCAEGYVPSGDRRRCIKEAVELGDPCEVDAQCTTPKVGNNLAICSGTPLRCLCSEGFAEHKRECLAIVTNVTTCKNDTQCSEFEPLARCLTTKNEALCLCPPEFISAAYKLKCVEISDYGQSCNVHQQCQRKLGPGGICENGVCHCDEKHLHTRLNTTDGSVLNLCMREVVLGSYCRTDEHCYQFHLHESDQSMFCSKGECNCKYGYNTCNNINCTRGSGFSTILAGPSFVLLSFATVVHLI